ncbi:DUF1349 domain-containing protein [Thorsellia anophelis]|uniref:Regulation of enolase protein 1, concanavalin A-like superfamily n=1 Tax=Thorsellia anophelis DSM 18579 TaxID=1123402 RepID=A0A1H9YX75_9GAMM|nr:DUF1349 domain-containing protein [Thorsellia anophelis]SES73170.1 hypothetical protein SAMN02583745_00377 [Thorsellia anophelis DSM 18579]
MTQNINRESNVAINTNLKEIENILFFTHIVNTPKIDSSQDSISLSSIAKTDFFNAPDDSYTANNAPLLLTKIDNNKPFVLSCKVLPTFKQKYDAGALFFYDNNQKWLKLAFELDDSYNKRIVSVKTDQYSDDCNHEKNSNQSIYLKIASDTKQIGCYYSQDSKEWVMIRLFKNNFSPIPFIGLSTQSPTGDGNKTIFSEILLTYENLNDFRLGI